MIIIRQETPQDYAAVENMTREAFWNVYRPGCSEHLVLHKFRGDPDFIPALDCVLEEDGSLAAHIMYCRAHVATDAGSMKEALMFGPVSVSPARQHRGLGSRIIEYSLDKAASLGFDAVFITGNPAFYHRFGFVSASKMHIYYAGMPREEEAPFFMVKELRGGALAGVCGTFAEPKGYAVDEDELARFDAAFPPKVKEKRPGQLA